ncbi:MAG: single-stranded DNA-binding protein [Erysipelotrichaceae bacterium]
MIKIIAVGRLTADLEIRPTSQVDVVVSNFTLACRDGKGTEFLKCTVWNELATTINKYAKKGDMLYVEGNQKTKMYENDKGIKLYNTFTNVEKFEFLGAKKKEETLI